MATTAKKTPQPGVYRLPDGRFEIRVSITDPVTKRRVARKRTINTDSLEQASEARASMMESMKRSLSPTERTSRLAKPTTLAAYAERWLSQKAKRLRPNTIDTMLTILGRRILPVIGEVPVEMITREVVEDWVVWAEHQRSRYGQPYSYDTTHGWWRVLGNLLRDAAADFGIQDPMRRVKPPQGKRVGTTEHRALEPHQLAALLDSVERHFPAWLLETEVMAFSGMRPSEMYALRVADVDLATRSITIRRSVDLRTGEAVESAPKTNSERNVALSPTLAEKLQATMRDRQPDDLLFPGSGGGYRGRSALYKVLNLAAKAADLQVRVGPKTLRKTFITITALDGQDRLTIRSNVGHTSEEMTERYASVPASARAALVESLEQVVRDARSGSGTAECE